MLELDKPIVLKNVIPREICKDLLFFCYRRVKWEIAKDTPKPIMPRTFDIDDDIPIDQGHQFISFCKEHSETPKYWRETDEESYKLVNVTMHYAWHQVLERLGREKRKNILLRIFWNYYASTATLNTHVDINHTDCVSMVFDLQSGKGATKIGDQTIEDEAGQVKIFNSGVYHKGLVYDKKVRFNCNVIGIFNQNKPKW
jgi:hypothetical protein